jgi:hypothetical protein
VTDRNSPPDSEIARVSAAWLAYVAGHDPEQQWASDVKEEWSAERNYATMSRFVLRLCRDVDPGDADVIARIGAGPLEDLIVTWPHRAFILVEAEVETNPTLLHALATVWTQGQPFVRGRIQAILARNGVGPSG